MMDFQPRKIAVIIDAENISHKHIKQIIDSMTAKGDIVIRQIIADWSNSSTSGWKDAASKFALTAIQQFSYVSNKNTCDFALVISAMKNLYEKTYITTFCLVSDDSDFTRLVQELKEHGKEVIGMGSRKAIPEFVNSFTEFIYLGETPAALEQQSKKAQPADKNKKREPKCPLTPEQLTAFRELLDKLTDEYGAAHYSLINTEMKKMFPDFVPENYGQKTVSQLIDRIFPFLKGFEKHDNRRPGAEAAAMTLRKNAKNGS